MNLTSIISGQISGVIAALKGNGGWLVAALTAMGLLRSFFKPTWTLVENYVRATPSRDDDDLLDEVEHSKGFKIFCWALDFFASIKVGSQFTAANQLPPEPPTPGATPVPLPPMPNGPQGTAGPTSRNLTGIGAVALLFACSFFFCGFSGCETIAGAVTQPGQVWSVTNAVPVVFTNTVERVTTNYVPVLVQGPERVTTNYVEHVTTNTVALIQTNTVTETRYVTNFVKSANFETGVKVAEAGASLAPPPFNVAAVAGLSVISGLAGLLATWKTRQSAKLAQDNATLQAQHGDVTAQLHAVITGVEQATSAIDPAAGDKVKAIIADVSHGFGVAQELAATVEAITPASKEAKAS